MSKVFEDLMLVEEANFTASVKLVTSSAISSLHYIKELSLILGIPIEDLTASHIIEDMKKHELLVHRP